MQKLLISALVGLLLNVFLLSCQSNSTKPLSDAGANKQRANVPVPPGKVKRSKLFELALDKNINTQAVKALVAKGEQLEARHEGMTPLMFSIGNKNFSAAKAFIQAGAKINVSSARGLNPLSVAIHMGNDQMVRYLLDHGADPNYAESLDHLPLNVAVMFKKIKSAEILIRYGADVNYAYYRGGEDLVTAIIIALDERSYTEAMFYLLIRKGAKLNTFIDIDNELPLSVKLIREKSYPQLEKAFVAGLRADFIFGPNYTALHYAAKKGDREAVEILLRHNADTRIVSKWGLRAADEAREAGFMDLADYLDSYR